MGAIVDIHDRFSSPGMGKVKFKYTVTWSIVKHAPLQILIIFPNMVMLTSAYIDHLLNKILWHLE